MNSNVLCPLYGMKHKGKLEEEGDE